MNFSILKNLFICCFALLYLVASAQTTTTLAPKETFLYGVYLDAKGRPFVSHDRSVQLLQELKKYQFNLLFPQVRQNADAYYLSLTEPRSPKIEADYLDPLSDLIYLSHSLTTGEAVLKVYPCLDLLCAHNAREEIAPVDGSVMRKHPQWLSRNYAGKEVDDHRIYILDPALPEVQVYLTDVVLEVVKKYDIDGICLDGLAYLDSTWGYNPAAVEMFQKEVGVKSLPMPENPEWASWRRQQLSHLLKRLYQAIKQEKPAVEVAVAIDTAEQPPYSLDEFHQGHSYGQALQDWPTWAAEGWLDAIYLRNFHPQATRARQFAVWLDFTLKHCHQAKVYVALSGKENFTDDLVFQASSAKAFGADGAVLSTYTNPSLDSRSFAFESVQKALFVEGYYPLPRVEVPTPTPTPTPVEVIITTPTLPLDFGLPITTPTLAITTTPTLPLATPTPEIATPTPSPSPSPLPPTPSPSPAPAYGFIHLKNGSVLEGRVLYTYGGYAYVETAAGLKTRVEEDQILRIEERKSRP